METYRHKKFDFQRSAKKEEKIEIPSPCTTPLELDDSSSCSDFGVFYEPRVKRRRLNSSICESIESESTTSSTLSTISPATMRDICKYHGNMVRKFPKKERTPKDQERRDKNTIACRMSRRVKKLEHLAIEEQYKEFTSQHMKIVEQSMRATVYLNYLNQLAEKQGNQSKNGSSPLPVSGKNFSIDYLIGSKKRETVYGI
ncbi:uncharacterized protein Dwil_GK14550 [Drosophila willistoni]|uniref:BZIP domain-containing protein n=1 Tax=Drosophila willistoni TaxID=7260 RepID=B4MX08_DROWI|nr:protein Mabiki [Drosophila willistoni]EDW76647.1 uncharacterized protein Dwil_GK14550 [Drosophila willistoni]